MTNPAVLRMIVHGTTIACTAALLAACAPLAALASDSPASDINGFTITIVFDNTVYNNSCGAAWGFACVIEGAEQTILFDTGSDGDLLVANMRTLGIDPEAIDTVVLSHEHWDHVDGLAAFLSANSNVTVIMPQSFSEGIKARVTGAGARLIETHDPCPVCEHIATTGELGDAIIEQGLVMDTTDGLIVITGCAHPGIVHMLQTVHQRYNRPIRFVLGGFHLKDTALSDVRGIIASFRELEIPFAGATHCTGEDAISLFAESYREGYVPAGAGRTITADDLE